jgi:hypothetical protein
MHQPSSRRMSPALVVSFVALFVALGGSAYAVSSTLPDNSVGTAQLRNGAVTTIKIADHAVTGTKLNLHGVTVPNAQNAANLTGAGWGLVDASPTDATLSDGHNASVSNVGPGEWCISVAGASPASAPIVVTDEFSNDSTIINPNIGQVSAVVWDLKGAEFTCKSPDQYAVVTYTVAKGSASGFHGTEHNNSFSFFVP